MSSFQFIEQYPGLPGPVTATDSAPRVPLGLRARAVDVSAITSGGAPAAYGVFEYCRGSNIASKGQFCQINNGSAVLLDAANSASFFPIGVAAGVLSATNVYGWVQREGQCDYARGTNSAIAAGVPLYICAGTTGLLVTNVVAGNHVQGVVAPVSYTSSQSASLTVQLQNPFVVGLSASL